MIVIENLTKTYPGNIQALQGINLTIDQHGMFGLLGVNGAGKTTLMRIIAGLLQPSGGELTVFGKDMLTLQGRQAVKELLGYLPQTVDFYPNLSAREFLDFVGILKGISDKKERAKQIDSVLEKTHLEKDADRRLETYSGGMKQRVGIAQALLGHPQLLIVDEPTSGLDPEGRVKFRNLLAEISKTCLVILSTHIVEDVSQSCNDLAVIREGSVLFRGSPGDLISAAQGKVWMISDQEGRPPGDELILVSTRQQKSGTEYRVLGEPKNLVSATPLEPTLEDGYLWLTRGR